MMELMRLADSYSRQVHLDWFPRRQKRKYPMIRQCLWKPLATGENRSWEVCDANLSQLPPLIDYKIRAESRLSSILLKPYMSHYP